MSDPASSGASPLVWTDDGQPRSRLYGDVYFSVEDGLAESRAVFLAGCGLPEAWTGRRRFVVGELGFGSGLNILALLDLWRRTRPPGATLHIFSIEAHPITAQEAARALSRWPEIADLAAELTTRWPGRARGFHRVEFPDAGAILDLAVMDVADALEGWSGAADAWFLDGFSPALNPQMWRPEVLGLLAARSAPGARAATFTVAGAVRRGLADAGFAVDKRPGFGRKRERLEARLPGDSGVQTEARRIAIIGGGVAGCAMARAARALGAETLLFDPSGPGSGASGNPAALVTPRLDAGLGPTAAFFAQALARAVSLYEAVPDAIIARGVLQLGAGPRDADRFARIAASDLFEAGDLRPLEPAEVAPRHGEAEARSALDMTAALTIEPSRVLEAWVGDHRAVAVDRFEAQPDGTWRLRAADGVDLGLFDAVVVCAGPASAALAGGLPMQPVRGQVSFSDGPRPAATAWGGYAAPTRTGLVFGATHDRDDTQADVREEDHRRNLTTLAQAFPTLAAELSVAALQGRAAVRATTSDHLPLAGAAPGDQPGVFLLSGLGGRGFTTAPLLAEHVAAQICGAPSPLPASIAALVDPARFARRAARRGGG
jgi:tRNA 5-methylaminomethyl-2-thiouridine biosynthesis bifunctional protein